MGRDCPFGHCSPAAPPPRRAGAAGPQRLPRAAGARSAQRRPLPWRLELPNSRGSCYGGSEGTREVRVPFLGPRADGRGRADGSRQRPQAVKDPGEVWHPRTCPRGRGEGKRCWRRGGQQGQRMTCASVSFSNCDGDHSGRRQAAGGSLLDWEYLKT